MAAVTRRDFYAVAAVYAPDAVWDVSRLGFEGVFEGRDAIRGIYESLIAPYEEFAACRRTPAIWATASRSPWASRVVDSEAARFVESRSVTVANWADGLVERLTSYTDIDQAGAAAERLAQQRG
jgi:hypothetical protein